MNTGKRWFIACGLAAACALAFAAEQTAAQAAATKTAASKLVKDGVVIDFEALPLEGTELMEGMLSEVRFKVTDERTGAPVRGNRPAAWLDAGANLQAQAGGAQRECVQKIGLYLKGAVGIRPLVDMNGYYLLVMNRDASITVIDPMVSMAGRTSTLTSVQLKGPPIDWVNNGDLKRLYVSMPSVGQVAVVDTESFKVVADIAAGTDPTRVVLQPDGRYLWVGNNPRDGKDGGVTVIDVRDQKVVMSATTGRGHHEIALSSDSRTAFVTNRDEGTVSVFDTGTLKKTKDIKVGAVPLSVAYSALSRAAYVSNGKDGTITVIDGSKLETVKTIQAKPGLGPLRFTADGRWGMVVNTPEGVVHVIDPGSNEIIHSPKVQEQPFQVSYTQGFAYVRSLGSERVSMINLGSLGVGKEPIVQSFAAGSYAPKMGGDLPLADAVVAGLGEAAAFVVSPADNATYFYMEGMNAPMSSYPSRGKFARAVTVVDRSLRETEPGVFSGRFRMPAAGHFDVALSLEQPRLVHCFSTDAKVNPALEVLRQRVGVEYLPQARMFKPKDVANVRFRIIEGTGEPKAGLKDVIVRYFLVPASAPKDVIAKETSEGVYEVPVEVAEAGAYYVYVSVPSLKLGFNDSGFFSVMARPDPAAAAAPAVPAAPTAAPAKVKPAKPAKPVKQG
ncbi:YVTN family beta-propeller repeat protein [Rubrivivax sp. A210]|uniref:YncE family protein n=1 Tax=Rubrivivax sp. A210 TaxID=2772301 RepID=UPI00191907CD|nr:cytochrome D1 domain-containing protein [Rubrivivax sp. A210]CAD5369812.1 YVTN family beta-propeller repeat protein [Rubrivivax sp. A210]